MAATGLTADPFAGGWRQRQPTMFIPVEFDRCIVCLKTPPGDPEHILPQCIGGRLNARLLCDKCNNHRFGSILVAPFCNEASVQQIIEALRRDVPKLYKQTFKPPTFLPGNGG